MILSFSIVGLRIKYFWLISHFLIVLASVDFLKVKIEYFRSKNNHMMIYMCASFCFLLLLIIIVDGHQRSPIYRIKSSNNGDRQYRQRGEQKMRDYTDNIYLCPIMIGTPPQVRIDLKQINWIYNILVNTLQTFNVQLDTGSSDLWVMDAHCNTSSCSLVYCKTIRC